MKLLLILMIQLYWAIIPKGKRRKCIFRTSCSQYVHQTTKSEGFYKGLMALMYRFHNCRSGFHLFEDPINGHKFMILPNAQIITEDEISERFINQQ